MKLTNYAINAMLTAFGESALMGDDQPVVGLYTANIIPGENHTAASLELATVAGLGAKACEASPTKVVRDPVSGNYGMQLVEPAGGLNFVLAEDLDEGLTIYGVALLDGGVVNVLGLQRFPNPIVVKDIGDVVPVDSVIGFLTGDVFGDAEPAV